MPPKLDKEYAITALRDVRHEWNLTDAWRMINPNECTFTYSTQTSTEHIQARLDRIYVAKNIEKHTFDWEIKETAIPSDHSMVTVWYAPKDTPYIGTGRWTLPLHLLNNEDMLEKIAKHGSEAQANITRDRIEQIEYQISNPQLHWESFKTDAKCIAKQTAKEHYHKVTSHIKTLERDIKETNNNLSA
jgi:hypothetical protein